MSACALAASLAFAAVGLADEDADVDYNPVSEHAIGDPKDLPGASVSVRIVRTDEEGRGRIPTHFVGFSIEWSLIERYFGPSARQNTVNLLNNLGTGVMRIGGSSQDQVPFNPAVANSMHVVHPDDLQDIAQTLDAVNTGFTGEGKPKWGLILGTALFPAPNASRPWFTAGYQRRFLTEAVVPAFSSPARKATIVGVEFGNEPDLSYGTNYPRYLNEWKTVTAQNEDLGLPFVAPGTSQNIGPWQRFESPPAGFALRWFLPWPTIVATQAPTMFARQGALGAFAGDHFYPLARTCPTDPYRCPSIPVLLDEDRVGSFEYMVYRHATDAAASGLPFRLTETGTAAGRGAPGVSNTAASALWVLDHMFGAACPAPGNAPTINPMCTVGAIGVNFHNAEVRAYFFPQEGNGYYNSMNYDPAVSGFGGPTAAPMYYGMLLFSQFAQGTTNLRRVAMDVMDPNAHVKAWQVSAGSGERLFLLNKSGAATAVNVQAPGASYKVIRMTPHDPAGLGRTLSAPEVRIDGTAVNADGTWPGFKPVQLRSHGGRFQVHLVPGEAVVIFND